MHVNDHSQRSRSQCDFTAHMYVCVVTHAQEHIYRHTHDVKFFSSVSPSNLQEVTLTFGEQRISVKDTLKKLAITFQADSLRVLQDEDGSKTTSLSVGSESRPGYLNMWREGRLAVGGLLGEIKQRCSVSRS